jgi:hypothetical protein
VEAQSVSKERKMQPVPSVWYFSAVLEFVELARKRKKELHHEADFGDGDGDGLY